MFPDALVYASVALDVVFLLLLALVRGSLSDEPLSHFA